jgi:hypothetical protein
MSEIPEENKSDVREAESGTNRRSFMKGAAVVGLVGTAVGASAALGAANAAPQAANTDPQTPATLGPHAMLDGRFPITYEESIPEGVRVLTAHFKALNQRDVRAIADTLHFPFGTVEGTTPMKIDTAQDFIAHAPASLNMSLTP